MFTCTLVRHFSVYAGRKPLARGRRDVLNLSHGVPLKRIERDITGGPLRLLYDDRPSMRAAFADQTRRRTFCSRRQRSSRSAVS